MLTMQTLVKMRTQTLFKRTSNWSLDDPVSSALLPGLGYKACVLA
jgi:hypothetical protein